MNPAVPTPPPLEPKSEGEQIIGLLRSIAYDARKSREAAEKTLRETKSAAGSAKAILWGMIIFILLGGFTVVVKSA